MWELRFGRMKEAKAERMLVKWDIPLYDKLFSPSFPHEGNLDRRLPTTKQKQKIFTKTYSFLL
jgi:hypothetical protein